MDNIIRNSKLRSFFNKCTKPFNAKKKLFQYISTWMPNVSLLNNDVVNTINEIENSTLTLIRRLIRRHVIMRFLENLRIKII